MRAREREGESERERERRTPAAAAAPTESVAILPFVDMSPERDQEYFCDGIAEEIINALCCMRNLRVASRTSSFQFKGHAADVREIGRTLGSLLVLQAMAGFGRAGLRKASLEVTAENASAVKLYGRLGFRQAKTVYKVVEDKARAASRGTASARSSATSQSASPDEAMLSHS